MFRHWQIERWPGEFAFVLAALHICCYGGDRMPVRSGAIMRKLVVTAAIALACGCAPSQANDERSCKIVAAAAQLSRKTNCSEGDIAAISGMSGKELPEAVARYCDFWGQIVVLPDVSETDASRRIVLCKYHQREAAPSQP
ncbi:hypothetical protein [Mesorhizobium sp. P5_C1]